MNPRIKAIKSIDGFQLTLEFSNGVTRMFDASPYLNHGVFTRLKDPVLFSQARVNYGTVTWPNELDISPDTIWLESR